MQRPTLRLLFIIVIAAIILGFYGLRHIVPKQSQFTKVAVLTSAPDFSLPLLDGGELRLSSYRGKVVLLDFWATWCVPCRAETPHFVELQRQYGDHGLQIIGVSMDDSPDPVHAFYQHFHINYPIVMGTADVGSAYGGVLGLPIAFLIDRDGRIYSKHMGATDALVFDREIAALVETH